SVARTLGRRLVAGLRLVHLVARLELGRRLALDGLDRGERLVRRRLGLRLLGIGIAGLLLVAARLEVAPRPRLPLAPRRQPAAPPPAPRRGTRRRPGAAGAAGGAGRCPRSDPRRAPARSRRRGATPRARRRHPARPRARRDPRARRARSFPRARPALRGPSAP